ncbi:MAG: site-specific integrase [Eubacterium sp.]|nr:site-specific integrase [Eubacterium sp.]
MAKKRADGRKASSFTYEGKRYFVYGNTASERAEKMAKKREELKKGQVDRENPTLNEYYKRFTENRRKKIKESTIRGQLAQFNNCASVFIPNAKRTLGEMRIRDIKPIDVQYVQQQIEYGKRKQSGNKYKRTTETVNNNINHLRHVFNVAVKDRVIDESPCMNVDNIMRTEKPARETIHRALSISETKRFMEKAKDSVYYNHFCLMILTGMRIGEIGALSMFDIDMKNDMIHVSKTVTREETGGYTIGSPKTDSGNREIPLSDEAKKCIQRQIQNNKFLFGDKPMSTIFRSAEGTLLREYPVNREIKRICKKAGITKFTCHAFRATFATRFIESQPHNYKALSEILGHSKVKITLDLYTHVMKATKITAMKNLVIAV